MKLIIVEGHPGSGKTTLTYLLHSSALASGRSSTLFTETHPDHPIFIGDMYHLGAVLDSFETKFPRYLKNWERFIHEGSKQDEWVFIESRLWLTGLLLLHLRGWETSRIEDAYNNLLDILAPASPQLIYLATSRGDLENRVDEIFNQKNRDVPNQSPGMNWERKIVTLIENQPWSQHRKLKGRSAYLAWLNTWLDVGERFFKAYPFKKCYLNDSHLDWEQTLIHSNEFLGFAGSDK